ncbi:MAG TPA: 4,5-DOPA dioxygenase extradiol [Bdellovibrionota bacterium]|nr:4,5-DOPA dioxygenase extradiol [Bdellovibrionota bacterium]
MTDRTQRMPVLFMGHGSPMNAIAHNAYTRAVEDLGRRLPRPRAILCVSAHWITRGITVTHMPHPRTIHDFRGFPDELFAVRYPAPGSPELAERVREIVRDTSILLDTNRWGLDHGAWSVLRHLYSAADVPVVQLSIDLQQSAEFHHTLGQKLRPLRDEGILIIGSGNIVHNLRRIDWNEDAKPMDWAVEFDAWVAERLKKGEHGPLVHDFEKTEAGRLSVPTPDHYLPFVVALGAAEPGERMTFEYEGIQNGSIDMRCVSFGVA